MLRTGLQPPELGQGLLYASGNAATTNAVVGRLLGTNPRQLLLRTLWCRGNAPRFVPRIGRGYTCECLVHSSPGFFPRCKHMPFSLGLALRVLAVWTLIPAISICQVAQPSHPLDRHARKIQKTLVSFPPRSTFSSSCKTTPGTRE